MTYNPFGDPLILPGSGLALDICLILLPQILNSDDASDSDPIIDGLTDDTTPLPDAGKGVRQRQGAGGTRGREDKFDAVPGKPNVGSDGVEVKILPDRRRVISRPNDTTAGKGGTIEVQSPKGRPRLKIRF